MRDPQQLSCQEVVARLDDFVDRELAPEELEAVVGHLQACAKCAPLFQFHRGFLERLQDTVGRIRAPEGLLESIIKSLDRNDRGAAGDSGDQKGEA